MTWARKTFKVFWVSAYAQRFWVRLPRRFSWITHPWPGICLKVASRSIVYPDVSADLF